MNANKLAKIARQISIDAKASGIGVNDLGCFYDYDWGLTDVEWEHVCNEAISLYPSIVAPTRIARLWSSVNADFRAEQLVEAMICGDSR